MPRRVLFFIRGKLGDTLVAFATVRRYADTYPDDEIRLLTRSNYAALLAGEENVRVSGFSSRLGMLFMLLKLRFEPAFDALLVLWGFGTPIRWIGRLVRARRKVYLDGRYSDLYPEYAHPPPDHLQSEPMWRVARVFEPGLPQPDRLELPSLAARRHAEPRAIGIAPLADEPRRIMSPEVLCALLRFVGRRHPGTAIRVFVNRSDRGAAELLAQGLPGGAEFRFFPRLDDLVTELADVAQLYCTDTGLYHLAASMGIPATVFFGPTQPWKIMMPRQPGSRGVRLAALRGEHCEEKSCASPVCLEAAVVTVEGGAGSVSLAATPAGCPLRALPKNKLREVTWHENAA